MNYPCLYRPGINGSLIDFFIFFMFICYKKCSSFIGCTEVSDHKSLREGHFVLGSRLPCEDGAKAIPTWAANKPV